MRKVVKQKIRRGNHGNLTEFQKVSSVVGYNYIATCIYCTFVLHQVLKVMDGSDCHSFLELCRCNRDNLYKFAQLQKHSVYLLFSVVTKKIGHGSKRHRCRICFQFTLATKKQNGIRFFCEPSQFNSIHQYVCVEKYAHYSLIHFVNKPNVRISISSAVNLSFKACSLCASVSRSHAACLSHSGAWGNGSNSHFPPTDALYSANFLARNASSSFRLASSASRMASFI